MYTWPLRRTVWLFTSQPSNIPLGNRSWLVAEIIYDRYVLETGYLALPSGVRRSSRTSAERIEACAMNIGLIDRSIMYCYAATWTFMPTNYVIDERTSLNLFRLHRTSPYTTSALDSAGPSSCVGFLAVLCYLCLSLHSDYLICLSVKLYYPFHTYAIQCGSVNIFGRWKAAVVSRKVAEGLCFFWLPPIRFLRDLRGLFGVI